MTKNREDDAMERLIEEIAFIISERAVYDIETDLYDGLPTGADMINPEEIATEVITRILQAFRDGELDEALGVVGRSKGTYLPGIGECETIALSPEGQEEEG